MFGKYITVYDELWSAEVLNWSSSFTDRFFAVIASM